jgi:hypothetical protein
MSNNKFWLNNMGVLFSKNNYKQIIPRESMTTVERLNAIARFAIYFIMLSMLMKKDKIWIMMGIFIVIMTVIMYGGKKPNDNSNSNDNKAEKFADVNNKSETNIKKPATKKAKKAKDCRLPTVDNPFMNPLANDLNTDYPMACNVDDDDIKSQMIMNYNESMFMNIDDLFDVKNSQRQFYTIPSNVPPRQKEFAEWCYGGKTNCKLDQEHCLKYEDLRYARDPNANVSSRPANG